MMGLDTNVLVRYCAQDDPVQSAQATAIIQAFTAENPGFITLITLTELVWVMQRCYKATKPEVAALLDMLLRTRELKVDEGDEAIARLAALFT